MYFHTFKWFIAIILMMGLLTILNQKLRRHWNFPTSSIYSVSLRSTKASPRILFYMFPQWHSMPENSRIHGWDFTDWSLIKTMSKNVSESESLQEPTELGWYNLLSYNVRKRQGELLREYGGYGFIYHIYWFTDHPVMDEPMRQMLADKDINIPYIVSWANEDWNARWTGGNDRILMSVDVSSLAVRRKFFQYLLPFFRDDRYIRVRGKPVFQAYQANKDMELVFNDFRNWAIEAGLPGLHCHQVLAHFHSVNVDLAQPQNYRIPVWHSVDGVTEFQPNFIKQWSPAHSLSTARIPRHHPLYHWRGLHVAWDNRPRYRNRHFDRNHPFHFERHLREVVHAMQKDIENHSLVSDDQYVVINGWNEWSEGNTMEPSNVHGRGYLEAMQIVVMKPVEKSRVCVLLAASHTHESFVSLSLTVSSIYVHLDNIEWEILAYSTDSTVQVPVDFMNYIRNTSDYRIRMIDVPLFLQQHNTSSYDVLRYLIPHCHTVRYSHYILSLASGEQLVGTPRPPANWETPWDFSVACGSLKAQERTAERIWTLEIDQTFAQAYAFNRSRYNVTCKI